MAHATCHIRNVNNSLSILLADEVAQRKGQKIVKQNARQTATTFAGKIKKIMTKNLQRVESSTLPLPAPRRLLFIWQKAAAAAVAGKLSKVLPANADKLFCWGLQRFATPCEGPQPSQTNLKANPKKQLEQRQKFCAKEKLNEIFILHAEWRAKEAGEKLESGSGQWAEGERGRGIYNSLYI